MITGAHALIFSTEADRVRVFLKDVLGFSSVDAGEGWLIFALPPAELGVHPADDYHHELSLMCDDIQATVEDLRGKGVEFTGPVQDQGFGLTISIKVPGGGELLLYEPRHPTPPRP
jgi:hypothetical protein